MTLKLITQPSGTPVDQATAKAHLRVIGTSEDALITLYLKTATAALDGPEGALGRALLTQTWELVLDAFPAGDIELPLSPLQSVTSVKYFDPDGVEQTLASGRYTVSTVSGTVKVDSDGWPETGGVVTVRFVAGYGAADDVPAPIKAAILLHVGDLFENRQIGTERQVFTNPAYDALTYPYRKLGL